jgi:ribA/ribD-fused uncharacterized protein
VFPFNGGPADYPIVSQINDPSLDELTPQDPKMNDDIAFQSKQWILPECAWFRRSDEPFQVFSNFAENMPLEINDFLIPSSEHLYQAMRFTHLPDIQFEILSSPYPKACKVLARHYDASTREDWLIVRVEVMRWVLSKKLAAHRHALGNAFTQSAGKPIVELSMRDTFWGARPTKDNPNVAKGQNVLGSLLYELRAEFEVSPDSACNRVPRFPEALLLSMPL